MKLPPLFSLFLSLFFPVLIVCAELPPEPDREFRGVWIATVDNIDFPTRKGLPIESQKKELTDALDLAVSLNLNAVVFQVRPMADAVYRSKIEPWSEFLTGEMGKPQAFDPLEFLCAEAHKRGILVHAWFNPYRAFHPAAKTVSRDHVTMTRPDIVRDYGQYKWLDPTDPDGRERSLSVVKDVVRRYDIDGVHFDDYFYPYPVTQNGSRTEFPDDVNWNKYLGSVQRPVGPSVARAPLGRDDWRRAQVNEFIEAVGREIKKLRPRIVYGISPFGVAEENYRNLYADAVKWLRDGTVDYFVPQLYWKIDRKTREFPILLRFWESGNPMKRHVWAGLGTYKIGEPRETFSAEEIVKQIKLSREIQSSPGNIHFSFKSLRNDLGGIQKALRDGPYKRAALIPEVSWIKSPAPAAPKVAVTREGEYVRVSWKLPAASSAFRFVVFVKDKSGWSSSIVPGTDSAMTLTASRMIEKAIVKAVDRLGKMSK